MTNHLALSLAWRNLWRNPRRTVLTAGAIAFAVFLLSLVMAIKAGQYGSMIENAAQLTTGHIQIQHKEYLADPRLRFVVGDAARLQRSIAAQPNVVAVFPRAQTYALVSVDERSIGAMISAVDPAAEQRWTTLPSFVRKGRYLSGSHATEAVLGAALARNLGIKLGAEVVILGSGKNEGVAALVVTVVGLVETGILELDRNLVQIPIDVFRPAFELDDEANSLVVITRDITTASETAQSLAKLSPQLAFRAWPELLPDLVQSIELNRISSVIFLSLVAFMVTFSIVNTFIMTVFERTREFGMLLAIGTRAGQVQRTLQVEALLLCLLGAAAGALLGFTLIFVLSRVGIPLPVSADELFKRFHMPLRIYPRFLWVQLWAPMLGMLIATQIAAFVPGLRLRRLQPVEALRAI